MWTAHHMPHFFAEVMYVASPKHSRRPTQNRTPQSERCSQFDRTDRNKPGLKRPGRSPEVPKGSVESVGGTAFRCSPAAPGARGCWALPTRWEWTKGKWGPGSRQFPQHVPCLNQWWHLCQKIKIIKRNLWFLLFWSWFQQRSQWKENS